MTVYGKWTAILILAGSAFFLSAQSLPIAVTDIKLLKAGFSEAPKFDVAVKGYGIPTSGKKSPWYMVLLEYVVTEKGAVKGRRGSRLATVLQNFEVEVYLSLPGKPGTDVGRRILLTGYQRFWMVKADNRKHYALFLIPPMIFEQYSYAPDEFAKQVHQQRNAGVEGIKMLAVFKNGVTVLGGSVFPEGKGISAKAIRAEFNRLLSDRAVFKIENGVLPKEKTPWQWLDADVFDLPASLFEGRSNGRQF